MLLTLLRPQGIGPGIVYERGDGVTRRWKKSELRERDRRLEEEKREKQQLRKLIEQALDPVKRDEPAKVVPTESAVTVIPQTGPAIVIQGPLSIDIKTIAAEVTQALNAIGVKSRRAYDAQSVQIAVEAVAVKQRWTRTLMQRRRDDEQMLLM